MDLGGRIRAFAISGDAMRALADSTVTIFGMGGDEAGSQSAIACPQYGKRKRRGPRLEGSTPRAYLARRDESGCYRCGDILVPTSGRTWTASIGGSSVPNAAATRRCAKSISGEVVRISVWRKSPDPPWLP